jgi:hypothetical protein
MTVDYASLAAAVAEAGFLARGGFVPEPGDGVPVPKGVATVRTLVLIGNAGPALWRAFAADPGRPTRGRRPLDEWTRAILDPIARRFGAHAVYPFEGPPYLPFQRWARRAEGLHPSPIGTLIHPEYGLWHAYRAAFLFTRDLDVPAAPVHASPCETCAEKPCLSACPVGAFAPGCYDVPACVGHLARPEGADCMELGCRARRACPVGRAYTFAPAQAAFHMAHFRREHRGT